MPLIPFPNVPSYPGVPALIRAANIPPVIGISLGLVQTLLANAIQNGTQWGIFDSQGNQLGLTSQGSLIQSISNGPILSTNTFEFTKESRIADFQTQKGGFASYNKVTLPANPVVTLAISGQVSDRTTFLNQIDAACGSTDLYSVVTPEVTYYNYSVERYSLARRAERGATLLLVEISLKEIRQVSAAYSTVQTPINQPQDPNAVPQTNSGSVQPQAPDQSVLSKAAQAWPSLGSFLGVN